MFKAVTWADRWALERVDRLAFRLQADHGVHITDIVKYGVAGALLAMTIVISTARGLTDFGQITIFIPYAMLWGSYFVFAVPILNREKRSWNVDSVARWSARADVLRVKLFPLRAVVGVMVIFFAFVPSVGDYLLDNPITWREFFLTVFKSIVVPGFVVLVVYLVCLYPVPPAMKTQVKRSEHLAISLQPAS
jgi:hypothetical protein